MRYPVAMRAGLGRRFRLLKIGAIIGFAIGILRAVRQRQSPEASGTASWPPLTEPETPAPRKGSVQFTGGVEPVDGACPPGYPIKAKQASKIFHVPGGLFYDRTAPDRCFANEADAEAAGYRQARR